MARGDHKKSKGSDMRKKFKLHSALLGAASVAALSSSVWAQGADNSVETVVVTGSRVISDAANSPTPVTIVSTTELQATTPGDISDALNKLPDFQGGGTQRQSSNGSQSTPNTINLRGFGANRTLVMLDGHRVTPTQTDGSTDVNVIPQLLISRVDVVTGGASAVYGSDAVTGVVNFIVDKNLEGIKLDTDIGASYKADAMQYKIGLAAGTSLFGGRAHIESEIETYSAGGLKNLDRPYGSSVWERGGLGTAASPYFFMKNGRLNTATFGGEIYCSNCGKLNGQQFVNNGVVGPLDPGIPSSQSGLATQGNVAGLVSGGDGGYDDKGNLISPLKRNEFFTRFSYNIDNSTTFAFDLMAAEGVEKSTYFNAQIRNGTLFSINNPFLPAGFASNFTNGTTTFSIGSYIEDYPGYQEIGVQRKYEAHVTLDGTLFGSYDWSLYYTHGEGRQEVRDPTNLNYQRVDVAADVVLNSANQAVCYVSTVPSLAALYPGCVPLNPFGPHSITPSMWNYIAQQSRYVLNTSMDDVGGSISGEVFQLPAGPLKAAFSAEERYAQYNVDSATYGGQQTDCTGLRLCTVRSVWDSETLTPVNNKTQTVWEIALEADAPVVKDLPFLQSFDVNLAGRHTDYSVSGPVDTWKIGVDGVINEDIRFRGTTSIDIRAPTLNDLFSPTTVTPGGFTDQLTATQGRVNTIAQGNPNLKPEVSRTYTAGLVLTPSFVPNLTVSADFYNINIHNAIGTIAGTNAAIQVICNSSGGTSPYCALFTRPLPYSNTTSANYPTAVYSEGLNSAFAVIQGLDFEANYHFDMEDIFASTPGAVNLRLLINSQPKNESLTFPGAPLTRSTASKNRATAFISYKVNDWSFNLAQRWIGGFPATTTAGQVYAVPRLRSSHYTDLTIDRKFMVADSMVDGYFSVDNLFNDQPPFNPTDGTNPGRVYPVAGGEDIIGRFFTVGIRAQF
jgi:outer membrane receptor protein involved in Fe transport